MTQEFKVLALQASSLVVGILMMTAVADTARAVPAPSGAVVSIGNFTFKAPTVIVKTGTTVTWVNDDDIPHTVVSKDGVFKSKVLDTGDRFSFTFAKPGQFGYFCSLHPHMTGAIIVKA